MLNAINRLQFSKLLSWNLFDRCSYRRIAPPVVASNEIFNFSLFLLLWFLIQFKIEIDMSCVFGYLSHTYNRIISFNFSCLVCAIAWITINICIQTTIKNGKDGWTHILTMQPTEHWANFFLFLRVLLLIWFYAIFRHHFNALILLLLFFSCIYAYIVQKMAISFVYKILFSLLLIILWSLKCVSLTNITFFFLCGRTNLLIQMSLDRIVHEDIVDVCRRCHRRNL